MADEGEQREAKLRQKLQHRAVPSLHHRRGRVRDAHRGRQEVLHNRQRGMEGRKRDPKRGEGGGGRRGKRVGKEGLVWMGELPFEKARDGRVIVKRCALWRIESCASLTMGS